MVTLQQLKSTFNFIKKFPRKLLTRVFVDGTSIMLTDLETIIRIKDNFGLKNGFHEVDTLGLVNNPTTDDIEDYPSHLFEFEFDSEYSFELSQQKLQSFIPFMSKDETRPMLNSLAINNDHLVATTGFILKFEELEVSTDNEYILPSSSLIILNKLLKKYKIKDDNNIQLNGEYFLVDNKYFTFKSKLILRDYPKWGAIVPSKFNNNFIINKWINIKELKPLFNKSNAIEIKLEHGNVNLRIKKYDAVYKIGECDPNIDFTFGFNAKLLDHCLNSAGDNLVKYNNEYAPFLINNNIGMPLKL